MATKHRIQIAACAARLRKPGSEIQLLPAGVFNARDGRPAGIKGWRLDAEAAARLIAKAQARQTPFVVDYEHQTLYAETSGTAAPAAAWFHTLEWREGDGLYAVDVSWTAKASAMIEADEYRYLSPVFAFDNHTGEVTELLMAAITNNPAIDGIGDVAAARFLTQQHEETTPVDEETLELLGLAKDATPEQIRAAIKAQQDKASAAETEMAALRASTTTPDPAQFVPVSALQALQTQVAALSAQIQTGEVDTLIAKGLEEGRLLPALEAWARDLGKKDVAALRSFIASSQPIAALTTQQTTGKTLTVDSNGLTEEELAVCRLMNQTPEEFLAAKGVKKPQETRA